MTNKIPVLLLLSGGIDSTALLDFYLKRNTIIKCIHFQYGQLTFKSEKESFEKITSYYNVDKQIVNLQFPMHYRKDELMSRNALFIFSAAGLGLSPSRIALGIHFVPEYYDCTKQFLEDSQRMLDGYYSGTVRVEAPFLDFSKLDIIEYCRRNKVPIELTYSCIRKNSPPCGKCNTCLERLSLYERT